MNALVLLLAVASAAPNFTGLWAARRNFGPDVRGTLEIVHEAKVWRATIAGRSAVASVDRDQLRFVLPNDEGEFRATLHGEAMRGHWIQSGGAELGMYYATPVRMTHAAPSRWRGTVTPLDDHFIYFLSVGADNKAFLRNPDRNNARFLDVRRIVADGANIKLLGGKDERMVAEGTYDAGSDRMAIRIRGELFDFHRADAVDEAAFYSRGKNPAPYVYRKPAQRGDGWPVGTLDEVNISRDAITAFVNKLTAIPIDSVHASDVHAVLIARHGKLVFEEYFHGTNPDEPHDTRSASKTLIDVLAGAAKVPASTPVFKTMKYPTDDPRQQAMTLEHLLTMSSGLDCDDDDDNSPGNENKMQAQSQQPDWYLYTLALKNIRKPGEKSVYCSCQPNLAGGVIANVTGHWLPDLFFDRVAEPMQMGVYGWDLMPTLQGYGGGGVHITMRDFLKVGQMMMDGGRWRGRQIVPASWAKASTTQHTMIGDSRYAYLWWINEYQYNGRTIHPFSALGNGGQNVFAFPDLDLVIGFFAGNYADRAALLAATEFVPKDILPAVR